MTSDMLDATFAPPSYDPVPGVAERSRLPEFESGEVEIAGIEFLSRVVSPISVRACVTDSGTIRYRVVDGFGSSFAPHKSMSEMPLTLAELVDLIDHTSHEFGIGLTDAFRDLYSDASRPTEREASFVRVTSPYYPQLEDYYDERSRDWLSDARDDPVGPKWLASRVAAFRDTVELRTAPPLHPFDLPDYRRIDELSALERARIGRWLRQSSGYPGATVSWTTTATEQRRSRRLLDTAFSVRFGPSDDGLLTISRPYSSAVRYPTVRAFFSSLAVMLAEPSGDADTSRPTPEVSLLQNIADDAWAHGDVAGAIKLVQDVLDLAGTGQPVPIEVVEWAAEFFLAVDDLERSGGLLEAVQSESPELPERVRAALHGRAIVAAVAGNASRSLELLDEASRIESPED